MSFMLFYGSLYPNNKIASLDTERIKMAQLENIEEIEKRLWSAADMLRSGSNYASNEYFMPVMGLIFLRHAYSRFLRVKDEIIATLPSRSGKTRALTKEDFSQKGAIFLQKQAQYDSLVALTDADDRAEAVIKAMESIESDYSNLKDQLPKTEYRELDNDMLGQLLRKLNPEELKSATGDVFGRIYEYFLTGFAGLKAHDGGEFFTPVSLVQLIVNIIEPDHGKILDPACGSGGMFVQSAHFVEQLQQNPGETLTFYGMEKNSTTIRLAKMNLAVHGLEGNIKKAITYYEDPHDDLWEKADFVMANPPFNVDEVDADKIKSDKRLPFKLPGTNKKGKVSNGNYLWISYFYSYLNEKGRAGFVMSSQASSAGNDEAKVREALIKTGHVDAMIDIRGGFFYTRTVPCQLWFLNKNKLAEHKDKVLMIDARNIFRRVNRTIYDFTPEQLNNISAIIWLYRGQTERFTDLVKGYIAKTFNFAAESIALYPQYQKAVKELLEAIQPFIDDQRKDDDHAEVYKELLQARIDLNAGFVDFNKSVTEVKAVFASGKIVKPSELASFIEADGKLKDLAEKAKNLIKKSDHYFKQIARLIEICEKELAAKESKLWDSGKINGARKNSLVKDLEVSKISLVANLKEVTYFCKQAQWLTARFPEGKLCDVEGLVKLVSMKELQENDWSLSPGRYVGVAPEEIDENFDFEETIREIHKELSDLNRKAIDLAHVINRNFEELGV